MNKPSTNRPRQQAGGQKGPTKRHMADSRKAFQALVDSRGLANCETNWSIRAIYVLPKTKKYTYVLTQIVLASPLDV